MTVQNEMQQNHAEEPAAVRPPWRLAVFDLDGTVLDTLDDLADGVNYALRKTGYPERSREVIRSFLGNGMRDLIRRSVTEGREIPEGMEDDWNRTLDLFIPYYEDHCRIRTKPYDGIPEMLQAVRDAGVRTALISNKADPAVQLLIQDFFPDTFDYVTGERKGVRRKPAPDAVNACLEKLGVSREDTVYIGDSEVDIETAEEAETDGLVVTWGFRDEPKLREVIASAPQPERLRIVRTPKELTDILTGAASAERR